MNVRSHFTMRKQGYAEIIKLEMGARLTKGGLSQGVNGRSVNKKYNIFVFLWTNSQISQLEGAIEIRLYQKERIMVVKEHDTRTCQMFKKVDCGKILEDNSV